VWSIQHVTSIGRTRTRLSPFAPNRLRHNFLSRVAEALSPDLAQQLAGHSDIATTMRYIHTAPKALIEAARKI
jgi:integrase